MLKFHVYEGCDSTATGELLLLHIEPMHALRQSTLEGSRTIPLPEQLQIF